MEENINRFMTYIKQKKYNKKIIEKFYNPEFNSLSVNQIPIVILYYI